MQNLPESNSPLYTKCDKKLKFEKYKDAITRLEHQVLFTLEKKVYEENPTIENFLIKNYKAKEKLWNKILALICEAK